MAKAERVERKLKRLRSIEASYRRDLKAAEKEFEHGRLPRDRLEKIRERCNRKIQRLLARVRELSRRGGSS
ncbi:MAG: hypothetical protein ACE5HJ_05235 [Thermoplasmata archaeon]